MIGYTGAEVGRSYGRMILDLDGMTCASNLPAFVEHDREKRAGYSDRVRIEGGVLRVEGILLANEHGAAIARDADQGFPFQASIGVELTRAESLKEGDTKTVNGRTFRGPGYVVTKSNVVECSFVSIGADGSTRSEVHAPSNNAAAAGGALHARSRSTSSHRNALACLGKRDLLTMSLAEVGSLVSADFAADAAVRAEFGGDLGVYAAYRKAQAQGLVKDYGR